MRVSRCLIATACAGALAVGLASTAPAASAPQRDVEAVQVQQPTPSPSRNYRVGEGAPDIAGLPFCSLRQGNAYVVIDQDHAVIIDGTARFVQAILGPGQTDSTYKVTFNRDGKSITFTPYGSTKPVTEVCQADR